MKPTDQRILQHLRSNARMNLTTLSRKTGVPVSTIFDRLKTYEQSFVQKFTVLVDFSKLGYAVKATVMLRVDAQQRDRLKSYLLAHPSVNSIYRINNGFDYATECVFSSIKDVEEFVESLEMQFTITDKSVYHIIDEIAREKALTEFA